MLAFLANEVRYIATSYRDVRGHVWTRVEKQDGLVRHLPGLPPAYAEPEALAAWAEAHGSWGDHGVIPWMSLGEEAVWMPSYAS